MLTPKDFYEIEREISRMYSKIETDLVRRICMYLYRNAGEIELSDWKLLKLNGMSVLKQELQKVITKDTQAMQKDLVKLVEDTLTKNNASDARLLDAIKDYTKTVGESSHSLSLTLTASETQTARMRAILQNARNGINLTNTRALEACERMVAESINNAYAAVFEGTDTLQNAVYKASKALARKGITVATYSSGRQSTISIDAAVRRNVVTSVSQATAKMTIESTQGAGYDLVRTSAHMGARPSHAVWQGQVFSISGTSEKYPALSAPMDAGGTGYGTAEGLCGCNCRHYFFPYVEGFEPASYGLDDITAEENAEAYEAQQKQRYYERQVRSWKRVKEVAQEQHNSVDESKATGHIRYYWQQLRDLCEDTGLPRQYDRERI